MAAAQKHRPATLNVGEGPDTLLLKISEDVDKGGDAKYVVKVDGAQIGGTLTASALHSSGQSDTVTVRGDWSGGPHTYTVTFLNDKWESTNLYVDGATYNQAAVPGSTKALMDAGSESFTFTDTGTVPTPTPTPPTPTPTPPPPPPTPTPPPPPPTPTPPPPTPTPTPPSLPDAPVGTSLKLTFRDEFDTFSWSNGNYFWNDAANGPGWTGTAGTWKPILRWDTRGLPQNGEKEWYAAPDEVGNPFSVKDGALHIAANHSPNPSQTGGFPYTSGAITSDLTFSQKYGYWEMKADLTPGQGLWPAFWLLPAADKYPPELDIMEVINDDAVVYNTVHTNAVGSDGNGGKAVPGLFDGFHTFGVSWRPDRIDWYVDGARTYTMTTPSDMHEAMYMIANLAVGGNWPGQPDSTTPFPAEMAIDHIRVWQYNDLL